MDESDCSWTGTNPKVVTGSDRPHFREFFNNEDFSDVKVFCGNKEFFGHKIVLSSCSEVFRTMLSSEWCNVDHLTLEENCQMEEVFAQFFEFLYTWKITFNEENITPLLMLADKYMVEGLIRLGITYMIENLSQENVVPWYKFSLQFNIDALYKKCVTFLGTNFDVFFANRELVKLEVSELMPILDSGTLVTRSEVEIFFLIVKWMNCYDRAINPAETMENMAKLMSLVRFPMMAPQELEIAENVPNFWSGPLEKYLLSLHKGYKFHLTGSRTLNKEDERYYVPRIYIRDAVSSVLPNVTSRTFYTPSHMCHRFRANMIQWCFKKDNDYLKVSFINQAAPLMPFATKFPIKVRFVVMVGQKAAAGRNIKYDAILTLYKETKEVYVGFNVQNDEDVKKDGMSFSILPLSV